MMILKLEIESRIAPVLKLIMQSKTYYDNDLITGRMIRQGISSEDLRKAETLYQDIVKLLPKT